MKKIEASVHCPKSKEKTFINPDDRTMPHHTLLPHPGSCYESNLKANIHNLNLLFRSLCFIWNLFII